MSPVTALSLGRIAIGAAAYARPALVSRMMGLDAGPGAEVPYVVRLFAVRDLTLGVVTLLARGRAQRDLLATGVAVDLGDAVAGALGVREGRVPARSAALVVAPAIAGVAAGVVGLRGRA